MQNNFFWPFQSHGTNLKVFIFLIKDIILNRHFTTVFVRKLTNFLEGALAVIRYAEVLVDVANRRLDQSYHYIVPEGLTLKAGATVLVTLKNRKIKGLVVAVRESPPRLEKNITLRAIDAVIEEDNRIPADLIELASWLAEITICPVAQALHTVWPFFKGKAETWIIPLAGMEDEDVKVLELLDPDTFHVLAILNRSRKKAVAEKVLLKKAGINPGLLEEMQKQGWISKETRFSAASKGKLTCSEREKEEKGENGHKREAGPEGLPGLGGKDGKTELSPAQKRALDKIWHSYRLADGGTVLLHGITGSGKTEIYREIVSRVISEGKEAIVLVPEISLTSQIARTFIEQFGDLVGVVHSGINPAEKRRLWQESLSGRKKIIIGARSAVFAPLPNLSLIILDEEHDNAYKQDENPKYHARDVARRRMAQKRGLVILGSATPSLEAYAAAQRKKIGFIYLGERYRQRALASVEIVDMKKELAGGNKGLFSLVLREKLRDRIEKGEQSILFLNRRGYSTFVFCRECGFVARCPHCDVSLTFHSPDQQLRCHYCGYALEVLHRCPECGSRFIRFFGQGTQKVEEEVNLLFPGVEVLRLDTDTTSGLKKHGLILQRFRDEKIPILVGTQMLAKGLDFPNVTLVGVISADQLLHRPDFRSRERAFQLLTQVAGRAGRGNKKGNVVIQTYSPGDRAIIRAAAQNYPAFFWEELAYRKQFGYPPFAHIIRVLIYHEKEERVIKAAQDLADSIRLAVSTAKQETFQILGPAPAVLTKLKNEFRWQVSLKGKNPDRLREIVHAGVKNFYNGSSCSGIKLNIEVNPLS